jgi:hypothetical protein
LPAERTEPVHRPPAIAQETGEHDVGLKLTKASWLSLYDGLNSAIKVRHYSPKTLEAYKNWTRKFQTFTKSKDLRLLDMRGDEVGLGKDCQKRKPAFDKVVEW